MAKYCLPISSTESTLTQVGGKGANLARLVQAGFPVPAGFVITIDAYQTFINDNELQERILGFVKNISPNEPSVLEKTAADIAVLFEQGKMPDNIAAEIKAAYHSLSNPAVAVRSSATVEDLPGMAFAGQQDTYLNVIGENEVLCAVQKCWGSLWTARAIAYRQRAQIPPENVAIAVVVQEMIPSEISGIAFTANPITGRRHEIVIDASFGLGEALVSGQVDPDHYVVDPQTWTITERKLGAKQIAILPAPEGGTRQSERTDAREQALSDAHIIELVRVAQRANNYFESPQDIEWAWAKDKLYLLQSRPITSLYPLPEITASEKGLRAYINFNSIQGVNEPFTPLGIDALHLLFESVPKLFRIQSTMRQLLPEAGGRLFLDVTALVGDPALKNFILSFLADIDPGARQTLLRLMNEGRFPSKRILSVRRLLTLVVAVMPLLWRITAALLKPEAIRPQAVAIAEQFVAETEARVQAAQGLAARLRVMESGLPETEKISLSIMPTTFPAFAFVRIVDRWLTKWLGEKPGAGLQLMRGTVGNVTIEMDLKLWTVAQEIRKDNVALEFMRSQAVKRLIETYLQHRLPVTAQRTLEEFLQLYGSRGAGELDLGRSRWRDDPTPIIHTLLAFLEIEDTNLAPDILFRHGRSEAERLTTEYVSRTRKTQFGWVKAKVIGGMIHRMRVLGSLREIPLSYLARIIDSYRRALLESAQDLVVNGQLECSEDIFFVPLDTLKNYAQGECIDLKGIVATNRASYQHEYARRQMPRVLLSTGEAFYEGLSEADESDAGLVGEAVSPGIAEGRVRVILDPHGARLEPGEILVCPSTNPGWTPLFLIASALVMEIGGLMTHGSIVAREYGIPAVVGVHQATTLLKDGQQIRVDGNNGRVYVL
jgi:rifampicin phosphotransferase